MQTLVIDTSYGSTVGMVGHDPSLKPTHAPTSKNYR